MTRKKKVSRDRPRLISLLLDHFSQNRVLSSANINIRSMHSDSELGIAMPNPEMTRDMQDKLWKLHAGVLKLTTNNNFKHWNQVLDKNWELMNSDEPLVCHLMRFWDVTTPYSPMLTVD